MHAIDDVLPTHLYKRVGSLFESNFQNYTEHSGRYGSRILDPETIEYLQGPGKEMVCHELGSKFHPADLVLSEVWACEDNGYFEIPFHVDDVYKRISCVLYMGEGFQGTSFLDISRGEITVEPKSNRLVCFESRGVLHRVKKNPFRRYTIQFHYHAAPMLDDS